MTEKREFLRVPQIHAAEKEPYISTLNRQYNSFKYENPNLKKASRLSTDAASKSRAATLIYLNLDWGFVNQSVKKASLQKCSFYTNFFTGQLYDTRKT